MQLTFKELRRLYLFNLSNIKVRKEREIISEERAFGELRYNFHWYNDILTFFIDREYESIRAVNLGENEREQYKHTELGEVSYLLKYLDYCIPVYIDDYGQQEVAVIEGEEIGAGAYNMEAEEFFCYVLDQRFEKQFLEQHEA